MYCLKKEKLEGHDVFEFMRGHLKEEHWLESSIYMTEEIFQAANLEEILTTTIGNFNYYGPTEITEQDWNRIRKAADVSNSEIAKIVISEIDDWSKDCFQTETCFTICGI